MFEISPLHPVARLGARFSKVPMRVAGFIALTLGFSAGPLRAAEAVLPLPKDRILEAYKEGDLDSVVLYIRWNRPKPMFQNREDSILAFKCLGVIYSSDLAMREKGRYYFNQLLKLNPQASITDFLPGEKVREVFKEVRDEFFELNPQAAVQLQAVPTAPPAPDTAAKREEPKGEIAAARKSSHVWWWVAGGAVVAAGAGTVIYLADGPVKVTKTHD